MCSRLIAPCRVTPSPSQISLDVIAPAVRAWRKPRNTLASFPAQRKSSGMKLQKGLIVHKSTHHFDLINWWIGTSPELVFGIGQLLCYGAGDGARRGLDLGYDRARGRTESFEDPLALRLDEVPRLRALYLDAEHEDGYRRDQNAFAPGVSIEAEMALLVRYRSGQ